MFVWGVELWPSTFMRHVWGTTEMINCYPVWTAAAPIVRRVTHHIGRRIARHGIRHAALATVRIVCVSIPAWLAAPSPAAAPDAPLVMPPPMLPWPGDEAPWGWGADYGPAYGGVPARAQGVDMPPLSAAYPTPVDMPTFTSRTLPVGADLTPHQPVPEPSSLAVLAVGVLVLVGLRAGRGRV